ncbi:MAG TPA: DUF3592 domain-containing protein [Ktedonobacterales bacterium]|nr:DUF3592 domain-containing protein [Ktedonobacterales bacterium]
MPSTISIITAIIGLFCVLVLLLALVFLGVNDSRLKARLQQGGAVVEGTVLDRKRAYVPSATMRFTLTYRYSYEGATHEYTQNVRRSLYEAAYPGQRIAVRCLPEDPAIVRIADDLL